MTRTWWTPSRRGASSTAWWATRSVPLLWDKVKRGISAGRVQTVALRLIVEREREIQAFQKKEYWTIEAHVEGKNPPPFDARLVKFQGKDLEIPDQASADHHTAAIKASQFVVQSVDNEGETQVSRPALSSPASCSRKPSASCTSPPRRR